MHKHDLTEAIEISSDANNNKNHHKAADTSRNSLAECNSPLRVALAEKSSSGTASVVISSLASPLLTATLNSPPVASINLPSNGSVDLSSSAAGPTTVGSHASIRKRILQAASAEAAAAVTAERVSPDRHGSVSPSSSTCNKEMYANLLMQLRHQGVVPTEELPPQTSNGCNSNGTSIKMSAAARKEKLKSQLCFQCPVCKKRFQRHIAMNAHFQAEHLGATSKNDKICKLCGFVGSDMGAVRNHLISKHNIDLETPTACLVEPEHCRSGSSSPLPSSSTEKKSSLSKHCYTNNNNSNTSVSIIRTSIVSKVEDSITSSSTPERRPSPPANVIVHEVPGYYVKQEMNCNDDIIEEAKDLSIKKIKRPGSPANTNGSQSIKKRHKTERVSPRIVVSSPSSPLNHDMLSASSSSSSSSINGLNSQWQCQHCNIIFPDQTLYFLHRNFHSNSSDPWKCNGCARRCSDMYDFNTHLMSEAHH